MLTTLVSPKETGIVTQDPIQRAAARCFGVVAQLGEHYNGIVEARSSILLGSTNQTLLYMIIELE